VVVQSAIKLSLISAVILGLFLSAAMSAQDSQQQQDIPDAPSASRPPQGFPNAAPATKPEAPPPANQPPPGEQPAPGSTPNPQAAPTNDTNPAPPAPPLKITTVPEGGATQEQSGGQQELYRIVVNTNQVIVPVMVKDDSGRLVSGLLPRDFTVYEDGKKQQLNFFTTDPFALSAAVIFDLGMPDVSVQKVLETLPALEGAFSQFDEVSIYTYSSAVSKVSDFATVGKKLTAALNELKTYTGRNNGVPVTSGPLSPQGPTINGAPVDPGTQPLVITPPKQSHVLNDALVAAAVDLGKRDRTRRKVIFIISDGREYRSNASYRDTLRVLLSTGALVYGLNVGGSAIPVYSKLEKLHLPRFGYTDILPKYTNATGGEMFPALSRNAIETVYSQALGDARNQYTLGYRTTATPSSVHREIEVKVARPDLSVTAKEGYYPVGLGR
jgi:VWFA-related protein